MCALQNNNCVHIKGMQKKNKNKNQLKQTLLILTTETRGVLWFLDTSYCKLGVCV